MNDTIDKVPLMEDPIPTFEEARRQYQEFLFKNNGLTKEILWIFREDVTCIGDQYYVKQPLRADNTTLAEKLLEIARVKDLGLRIQVLCLLNSHPCCYIWVPADAEEADEHWTLHSKFVMAIREDLRESRAVKSEIKWKLLRAFEKPGRATDKGALDSLPLRKCPP